MSKTVFFCPGKLGDAILQLGVARAYADQENEKVELWLDSGTCKPLRPLCDAQPWVESTRMVGPSDDYLCGGRPWQGNFTTQDHMDREIVSLGFRKFPSVQITLETLRSVPLEIKADSLADTPTFHVEHSEPQDRVVLHGTFQCSIGTPGFWRFLRDRKAEFQALFDELVFIGTPSERERVTEIYPDLATFDDHGSLLEVAVLMKESRCVIGSGSAMVALASSLNVPCVRVHDPIGNAPKVIWSGLGSNQVNESEVDLRKGAWAEFRDRWLVPV